MIKLKDLLLESTAPDIFIPRRMEDRLERMIKNYIRDGSQGDLNLRSMNLTVLPDILKNVSVSGHFFCSGNKLVDLKNSPKYVGDSFHCNDNELTSLIGAPSNVSGHFYCYDNKLTSLDGAPKTVGGNFSCNSNDLTSLEGAPKSVGGHFHCFDNTVQFTEKQVRSLCDVKGRIYV